MRPPPELSKTIAAQIFPTITLIPPQGKKKCQFMCFLWICQERPGEIMILLIKFCNKREKLINHAFSRQIMISLLNYENLQELVWGGTSWAILWPSCASVYSGESSVITQLGKLFKILVWNTFKILRKREKTL